MALTRRQLLALTGVSAVTAALPHGWLQANGRVSHPPFRWTRFGDLQPDPNGVLDLPEGYRYQILSQVGDRMDDDQLVPDAFDGMGAFTDADGNTVLIRNHELLPYMPGGLRAPTSRHYDPRCNAGTTTLVISPQRQVLRQFVSLAGTVRNCAGGQYQQSWISCEETVATPATNFFSDIQVDRRHGYNFQVPANATEAVDPMPLVAMGRFNHEAIATDPRTHIVYQTEDRVDGLFYRFIPDQPDQLSAGGRLEALRIRERSQAVTRQNHPVGVPMAVDWVTIDEVDPSNDTVRAEGFAKGAAQFSRGEGICYSEGTIYFTCTSGGNVPNGQIWKYTPSLDAKSDGTLELIAQPDNPSIMDYPDNLIVAPSGDLIVCEDGQGEQFVLRVSTQGEVQPLAHNAYNQSEFAGVCFSADGQTLFLNRYSPGMTVAIWAES